MIHTVTSLKGGVGKTTISGLLALYLSSCRQMDVLLVDLDPQAGSTSLFLGGKSAGATVYDLIQAVAQGDWTGSLFREALHPLPPAATNAGRIFVIPGDPRLINLTNESVPEESLQVLLENADLPDQTVVIVDTGTLRSLVGIGIAAADAVLVPLMLSQQTIKPTVNTLSMIQRQRRPLLGLMPVEAGEAHWETDLIAGWSRTITNRFGGLQLLTPGGILPYLPHSKMLARGQWAASGFPERFLSNFQMVEKVLFAERLYRHPGAQA